MARYRGRLRHAEEHANGIIEQLENARDAGRIKLTRMVVQRYLRSHDARIVAAREAYKIGRPHPAGEFAQLAEKTSALSGTVEPVKVFSKPKGTAGHRRVILSFEVENRVDGFWRNWIIHQLQEVKVPVIFSSKPPARL
ncbi:hypothetical protein ACVWXO_005375 [Bradyrhizobium sp. LM2.7]